MNIFDARKSITKLADRVGVDFSNQAKNVIVLTFVACFDIDF